MRRAFELSALSGQRMLERKISSALQLALPAIAILAFAGASPAKADTNIDYTVNGIYNDSGTLAGTFDVDATTETVTAIDLVLSASGGVSANTFTTPSDFDYYQYPGYSSYTLATFFGQNLQLNFAQDGGSLNTSAGIDNIGSSYIQQYFGPGYTISGTVTVGSTPVSAAPEPSTWALMLAGIGGMGLVLRQAKRKHGFAQALVG